MGAQPGMSWPRSGAPEQTTARSPSSQGPPSLCRPAATNQVLSLFPQRPFQTPLEQRTLNTESWYTQEELCFPMIKSHRGSVCTCGRSVTRTQMGVLEAISILFYNKELPLGISSLPIPSPRLPGGGVTAQSGYVEHPPEKWTCLGH